MKTVLKMAACALALSLFSISPAIASGSGGGGGGGGGSFNTNSGPTYNPVQDYQKGVSYLREQNFKKAERSFSRVLKGTTRNANANYLMGLSKVGLEKHKSAARYFKSAVRYDKNLIEARGGLGAAYANYGKIEKSQAVLAELETMAADCNGCANASRITQAISSIKSALAGAPQKQAFLSPYGADYNTDTLDTQYFASVSLINQGQYQEAFNDLTRTAAVAGPHPDITTYMGYTQRKLGNYDLAKSYYAMALEVDPNHKGANEYLGELYVETGQLDLANVQLAKLENICTFGCIEENELRSWIIDALP